MKKVIFSFVAVMYLFLGIPVSAEEESTKEPVPVYMFTKEGCSACEVAYEYFNDLEAKEPDLFDLISIEVFDGNGSQTSENAVALLIEVYEKYGEDSSKASTPTIVIGDYHTLGFPQDDSIIYDAIIDARDDEEYVDEVKKIADDLSINIEDLEEKTGVDDNDNTEGGKYDILIIIGVFVVLIGGIAGLVIAGKK